MTSDVTGEHAGVREHVTVYLDANVLATGLVRTLVLLSGPVADYRSVWSPYAEAEAAKHQRAEAMPIRRVRELHDLTLVADRPAPTGLVDTDAKDRPILASAAAAGALLVVTSNVRDFGARDLAGLSMSAVHPDLFLATRVSKAEYVYVLDSISEKRERDPRTPHDIHAGPVANTLPLLFATHRDALGVRPAVRATRPARLQFRGVRCLHCTSRARQDHLTGGLCPACRGL